MVLEEEKIAESLKIAGWLLFTLLGVALTSETFVIIMLLFYIAFIKE